MAGTEAKHYMKWYCFDDLYVKELFEADHAVTRDATGFVFELVEDPDYDKNEQDENIRAYQKAHDITPTETQPSPGEDSAQQQGLLELEEQIKAAS